jgi:hypothetical protein
MAIKTNRNNNLAIGNFPLINSRFSLALPYAGMNADGIQLLPALLILKKIFFGI